MTVKDLLTMLICDEPICIATDKDNGEYRARYVGFAMDIPSIPDSLLSAEVKSVFSEETNRFGGDPDYSTQTVVIVQRNSLPTLGSINITTDQTRINPDGWDFPLYEISYLCEEHDGETFVLIGDRLYETTDEKGEA